MTSKILALILLTLTAGCGPDLGEVEVEPFKPLVVGQTVYSLAFCNAYSDPVVMDAEFRSGRTADPSVDFGKMVLLPNECVYKDMTVFQGVPGHFNVSVTLNVGVNIRANFAPLFNPIEDPTKQFAIRFKVDKIPGVEKGGRINLYTAWEAKEGSEPAAK